MSPIENIGAPDPNRGTAPSFRCAGRLAERRALVTGAGSGIGRATARRLAGEGAQVACLDVAVENLDSVVEEINGAAGSEGGGKAVAIPCDVTDETSVTQGIAAAVQHIGTPQVVCNIAGVGKFAHTAELSLEEWNRVIAINLTGTFLVCRAALPYLLEGGGVIVNTSSTAGKIGQPYSAAYCASKGGVSLLTKALAVEYSDRGVRVNAVAPGGVDTPIIWDFGFPEGANMKLLDRITSQMGYAEPSEIAGLFAYLASDEAAYISGAIVSVDGTVTA